ncbi:MAG: sigma-70 family RNA polymerase sigma factor [Clostridiales bacterium]|nr:sigma-70 family RNA polymerase sigma factor [Clostridiales bacterium]
MDISELEKQIDSIFAYCIRRTKDIEDAKDLSQDIVCEILRSAGSTEIVNFEAWIWKIAHNRYVKYLNGKKKSYISIYESGLIDTLVGVDCSEDHGDEYQAVFVALHSIAQAHRALLVDRYVNELTCAELAEKYGLPEGTVKTRLHYGRQKLKERWQQTMETKRIYEKRNWFVSGNGDVDVSYIGRQLPRAIVTACYERPLSIEEISEATGIPCMYVEDEIPSLLKGEIISERSGKYLANIIVHGEKTTSEIENILMNRAGALADATAQTLAAYMPEIRNIGFHGCSFPDGRLWWSIIPMLWREACEQARQKHGVTARCSYPPRLDGGKGWIFANVAQNEEHKYFSGCNGYFLDSSKFYYYWSSKYFAEELNMFLYKLENHEICSAEFEKCGFDELLTAECIKYGLVKNNAWAVPVFTADQYEKFERLIAEIAKPLSSMIYPQVEEIYKLMRRATPKHLHEQIRGVFGAELNSIIAMICDELEARDMLEAPGEEFFTGQIVLTLG